LAVAFLSVILAEDLLFARSDTTSGCPFIAQHRGPQRTLLLAGVEHLARWGEANHQPSKQLLLLFFLSIPSYARNLLPPVLAVALLNSPQPRHPHKKSASATTPSNFARETPSKPSAWKPLYLPSSNSSNRRCRRTASSSPTTPSASPPARTLLRLRPRQGQRLRLPRSPNGRRRRTVFPLSGKRTMARRKSPGHCGG
jgi:hypothetical protein